MVVSTDERKDDRIIGRNLRQLRNANGCSQEKLAAALGITFQQIQKYERGINRLSGSRICAVSKLFNVPPNVLFEGTTAALVGKKPLDNYPLDGLGFLRKERYASHA